ncbi:hypothetical protein ABBQ38_014837 [Trebouxia sp. C0009 RCD-2024]
MAQLPTKDATWAWGQNSFRQWCCRPLAHAQAAALCSWRQHEVQQWFHGGVGLGSLGILSLGGGRRVALDRCCKPAMLSSCGWCSHI